MNAPAGLGDGTRELVDAVQRLSLARTLGEVQEIVRTTARTLCGADGATFVLRDGDRCYYADEDAISPLWKGQRFPLNTCISGWAMLNRRSAAIEDIYVDDRIPHDAYRPTFVHSLVMVPIRRMHPIGAIGNYWAEHHRATEHELDLLQALADATAVAMENVRVWSEMEARVADRTLKLQAALDVNERLLGTVSHEVRNALGASQMLLASVLERTNGELDATTDRQLRLAHSSAMDGVRIVTEQLDLAKSRAGRLAPRPSEVDPQQLLGDLATTYDALRRNDRVALVVRCDDEIPAVRTDPHLLTQALRNLVSNALKFTDVGEVTLGAVYRAEPDEVAFSVADTGLGIAPHDRERIFQEFGQIDADQAGRPGGTGLGLPYVGQIAAILGARLDLESAVGRGSTFTLAFPRR